MEDNERKLCVTQAMGTRVPHSFTHGLIDLEKLEKIRKDQLIIADIKRTKLSWKNGSPYKLSILTRIRAYVQYDICLFLYLYVRNRLREFYRFMKNKPIVYRIPTDQDKLLVEIYKALQEQKKK